MARLLFCTPVSNAALHELLCGTPRPQHPASLPSPAPDKSSARRNAPPLKNQSRMPNRAIRSSIIVRGMKRSSVSVTVLSIRSRMQSSRR